jgi:hypothetical protein
MEARAKFLSTRSGWHKATRYVVALLCVALSLFFRWLLDPFLGNNLTLLTICGGVAFAVWFGGFATSSVSSRYRILGGELPVWPTATLI